jgi:LPXTG-motif cell wall-anchored protein
MKRIAVAALALGLPLLSVATAHADTNTVTISGVAWKDLNGDGIRQAGEPLLPGIKIGGTTTDATGHYTLHNQSATNPSIQATPYAIDQGRFVYTHPHQGSTATDSDFDWNNGWLELRQQPVNSVIDNVDVGYMPTKSDAGVKITPKQANPVKVGDDVTYEIEIDNNEFPSYVGVRVVFPDGVQLDHYDGPNSTADPVGATGLDIRFLRAQEPSTPRIREVSGRVTKPIDGTVTALLLDRQTDVDGADDRGTAPLKTVDAGGAAPTDPTTTTNPAPTSTTTPTTTAPKAQPVVNPVVKPAALANTGVDPVWPLVGGLTLLAAGFGAIFFARRRRA